MSFEAQHLALIPLAFVCEFVDSTLGMGYGTILTPVLLLCGFDPLSVIPAILLSELVTGFSAGIMHHGAGNVDLSPRTRSGKVAVLLSLLSLVGAVVAVNLALTVNKSALKMSVSLIVVSMGLYLLLNAGRTRAFSWFRVGILGLVASFNKGVSAGGYGPLVTGGQMMAGVSVKNSVGITCFSEGFTSLVAVVLYFSLGKNVEWVVAPYLMAGALLSVPFSALALKRMPEKGVRYVVATAVTVLGCFSLLKAVHAVVS